MIWEIWNGEIWNEKYNMCEYEMWKRGVFQLCCKWPCNAMGEFQWFGQKSCWPSVEVQPVCIWRDASALQSRTQQCIRKCISGQLGGLQWTPNGSQCACASIQFIISFQFCPLLLKWTVCSLQFWSHNHWRRKIDMLAGHLFVNSGPFLPSRLVFQPSPLPLPVHV